MQDNWIDRNTSTRTTTRSNHNKIPEEGLLTLKIKDVFDQSDENQTSSNQRKKDKKHPLKGIKQNIQEDRILKWSRYAMLRRLLYNYLLRIISHVTLRQIDGATRGATVSTSAFQACHQCYCAGLSLAWGLNLRALVWGIFWSSSPVNFFGYSGFLPSFIGLMVQPIK